MSFSRKEQWIVFSVVNGLLIAAVALFPVYGKLVDVLPLGRCMMLDFFHLYCPACGGTRAFAAMLRLDIIASVKYNPVVLMSAISLVVYEIAMVKHLIKGGDREMLVKPWMVFVFLGIWFTYSIVRNVLLAYGIDILGNVL